jgi:hypothetical protein
MPRHSLKILVLLFMAFVLCLGTFVGSAPHTAFAAGKSDVIGDPPQPPPTEVPEIVTYYGTSAYHGGSIHRRFTPAVTDDDLSGVCTVKSLRSRGDTPSSKGASKHGSC